MRVMRGCIVKPSNQIRPTVTKEGQSFLLHLLNQEQWMKQVTGSSFLGWTCLGEERSRSPPWVSFVLRSSIWYFSPYINTQRQGSLSTLFTLGLSTQCWSFGEVQNRRWPQNSEEIQSLVSLTKKPQRSLQKTTSKRIIMDILFW